MPVSAVAAVNHTSEIALGVACGFELEGRTRLTAVPDVTIDWDPVLDRIC